MGCELIEQEVALFVKCRKLELAPSWAGLVGWKTVGSSRGYSDLC